ncbi:MAG TPA: TetR/AcrR family transcriptional regulator [Gemmatimonadota bacterium]|nr:TetR/AcrR family transcriptional regulator [Gemmatimonadota bacterium]
MNERENGRRTTSADLLEAARDLFADRGYDGASIRAITDRAGTNLGSVTYHFGTKEALYHRVIETFIAPLRERVVEAAGTEGPPLERIEAIVRAAFERYVEDPAMPRLILQQIASGRPAPPPARAWIRQALGILGDLVHTGQADGTIRKGDPRFMALMAIAPILFIHLIRGPLHDAIGLDLDDERTRKGLLDQIVASVRGGLAAEREAA